MKCNAVSVFALGAVLGSAATVGVAAMDPALRRRMVSKVCRMGRLCAHKAECMFR